MREKATHEADLPHAYDQLKGTDLCHLCGAGVLDARHLAWEKAHEQATPAPGLPRELGV